MSQSGVNQSLGLPMGSQAPSFRSTVNLVLLDVLVTDGAGRPVAGLERSNFRLKVNNQIVTVDRVTTGATDLSLGLVLDYSRSMRNSQARVVQAVAQLRSRLDAQDEAFVLVFNEVVKTVIPAARIGKATATWSTLLYPIQPDGQTALFDAIVQGTITLRSAAHPRRAVLVLSDGQDTASRHSRADAEKALMESNILFYAVGLFKPGEMDTDPRTLSSFADRSGGRAIFEPSVDRLGAEFDGILAELRARYVLGFLTGDAVNGQGETRRVQVSASDANGRSLRIRTRQSFFIGDVKP